MHREVLLIVPTHDHASTLDLAVRSVLEQTVADLDVAIIGDGVGDDTREVVAQLLRADERVRFVDRPKSPSRAEDTRHELITTSDATIVTYLGDDDLLLADHVESMRGLLREHDFAHPFPILVDGDERLRALPTDLGDPRCVAWHVDAGYNTVSLTGAAHTMDVYRRLPRGWEPAPPGRWPDHYMWEQILRLPGIRAVTAPRSTTIKPASDLRPGVDPAARRASLEQWWDRMHQPGFRRWWDSEVADALRRSAVETYRDLALEREQVQRLEATNAELGELASTIPGLRAELAALSDEAATAQAHLELIEATRTWRLHDRVARNRLARRVLARRQG